MSIEADVGQILWLGFEGELAPSWLLDDIEAERVGSVILFRRNLRQVDGGTDLVQLAELNASLHAAAPSGNPLLISVDQEGGRVARVRQPATIWPPMSAMNAHDSSLAESVGRAMGLELAALGFDIDFAPVLDVHTNPANPIIGDRAFSTRAARVAELAVAFARGLKGAGILGCGKHFPGHGDTDVDSHLALPTLAHDLERLREVELVPFAAAARARVPMLMTAHVVFEAVDAEVPATLSRKVLQDVLRSELGYRGVVVSDDLDMKAIADHYGVGDAAVRAVRAGCDALLLCRDRKHQEQAREAILEAASGDAEFRARLGAAAERVRGLKEERAAKQRPSLDVVGCAEHRRLAEQLLASS